MFAGHVGAGLALGRFARRINPGWLVGAALALDLLLWLLVIAGIEQAAPAPDFARRHYFVFSFPYSHGLVMSLAWSVSGALIAWSAATGWGAQRARAAAVVAAAIFSHWVLDALVHVPGLPLLGAGSAKIGLGLWSNVPVALTLEGAITLCGLGLFLWGSGLRGRPAVTLCAIVLAALAMTIFGMLASEPPPDVRMQALASIIVMLAVAWMVGRMVRPSAIGESPDPDGEQEHERA